MRSGELMPARRARPRYETLPTKGASSWAPQIRTAAKRIGVPLMPWQGKAARLIGELDPDGYPRWDLVIISVPRQSGKTTIAKASTAAKAERHPGGDLYGTAQSRLYAVKHLEKLALALGPEVKARLGTGAERITWRNGSKYEVIAPNDSGGHGDSILWMLIDEGWKLESHVLGGLRPAMSAQPHSQMLIISTMGAVDSEVWNGLVTLGREAIDNPEAEPDFRIAYLEYSAPDDDAVFDPKRWADWMPALTEHPHREHIRRHIMADMKLLPPHEFVRAYGNRTVASLSIVFPEEWYSQRWVSAMEPPDRMVLSLDVNEDPKGATISSGHMTTEGAIALRTIEWRLGSPNWVTAEIERIILARNVEAVVGDFGGPARQIYGELVSLCERRGVPLVDRKPRELGGDTIGFHDALRDGSVAMERNELLETALRGAARKNIGDLWVPHRKSMRVDPSPLISAILAYGVAKEFALAPRLPAIW